MKPTKNQLGAIKTLKRQANNDSYDQTMLRQTAYCGTLDVLGIKIFKKSNFVEIANALWN